MERRYTESFGRGIEGLERETNRKGRAGQSGDREKRGERKKRVSRKSMEGGKSESAQSNHCTPKTVRGREE